MRPVHVSLLAAVAAALSTAAGLWLSVEPVRAQGAGGQSIYAVKCAACHNTGLLGAPRTGQAQDWAARTAQGREALVRHAIEGFKQMPARGGNPGLSDADVTAAVDYMLAQIEATQGTTAQSADAQPAPATAAAPAPPPPKPKSVPVARHSVSGANSFNRLMEPPSKRNPPPSQDGIHDPASEGTKILQSPRDAFAHLPKSSSGNRVDWVAALRENHIKPRYDRLDDNAKPVIMDLNIVREVKGSMPDVVYPHEAHTQWLDCSNCHPAIFLPQKGANQMSMAAIILGKQCGVCHGKVAFPIAECRRCHSRDKAKGKGGSQ